MSIGFSEKVLLGTSGWSYDHWKERFYPQNLSRNKWFEYFTEQFDTVELNASFYRIPTVKITEGWKERSPDGFRFSVKVSRLITHVKKLKDCRKELEWFFSVFEPLKEKVCIYLLQLPPNLKVDIPRLEDFSKLLPSENNYAFEFRNPTWYSEEVYEFLKANNFAFCIHDMPRIETGKTITSENVYIRFHGHQSLYGGDYPREVLENWADWITRILKNSSKVMGYFNNDIDAFSVKNCKQLKMMIENRLK